MAERIRCGARCGSIGMNGHLEIEYGAVRYEFTDSAFEKLLHVTVGGNTPPPAVVHADLPVTVIRARWLPPPIDKMLVLEGDGATVVVLAYGKWGTVMRALAEEDIPVREQVVRFAFPQVVAEGGNPNT